MTQLDSETSQCVIKLRDTDIIVKCFFSITEKKLMFHFQSMSCDSRKKAGAAQKVRHESLKLIFDKIVYRCISKLFRTNKRN